MAKFYVPTKISENIRETPEGYLLCLNVPIARTGWQDYGDGETPLETVDGVVRIYRDDKEVFRPQTLASFEGKSITIQHPRDFVNPENWKDLSKGIVQNVRRGDKDEDGEESILADLLITDSFAIQLVKSGLREVSCGYEAEYEQMGKGKGKQINIVGNHLALVEQGRAGTSYAINDHKGKDFMSDIFKNLKEKIAGMAKVVDEAAANTSKFSKKDEQVVMKDEDKEEKEEKAKDDDKMKDDKMKDAHMMDELVEMVNDLAEKISGMKASKDAEKEPEEKEEKAKDDDEKSENETEAAILERVKALESALAQLLKGKNGDADEEESAIDDSYGEEKEKSEDEEGEGKAEKADDAEGEEGEESEKKSKAGDSKRAGLKTGLEKTVAKISFESFDHRKEIMTPEKMNELNAAHWARK
jgi:uncharacterized protein